VDVGAPGGALDGMLGRVKQVTGYRSQVRYNYVEFRMLLKKSSLKMCLKNVPQNAPPKF
jgi:hypothetical protein